MATTDLSFAPLDDLVAALIDGGVRATQDPSDLNLPGAWVTLESVQPAQLDGGWAINALVFLIVADTDHRRAAAALADLFNTMTAAGVQPDGAVIPQPVVLPDDATTELPALRVPVQLFTT